MLKWAKRIFSLILCIGIICIISESYAFQNNPECKSILSKNIFDFIRDIYTGGFLALAKDLSWTFLILLLFIFPPFYNKVKELGSMISEGFERYGKSTRSIDIIQQNEKEKKLVQEEKENELIQEDSQVSENDKNRQTKSSRLEEIRQLRNRIETKIKEDIKELNIEDFREDTKILVENDPVASVVDLRFDVSYRYKKNDRARRYISTIFVPNSLIISLDRLYKYIRIMMDINQRKTNQRHVIEIVLLNLASDKELPTRSNFDRLKETYERAISSGILAIKEYGLKEDEVVCIKKEGWVLE
jgi:hypothetical protein